MGVRPASLTLQACAVNVVRRYPALSDGELVELIKRLAIHRGVRWSFGGDVTDALERARRYEPKVVP